MMVDLVLAFDASPATSVDREYRNLLTRKEGSVMRKEVLTSYRATVQKCAEYYKSYFRQITTSNTDNKDQDQVSYDITKLTLDKLQGMADEKIGCIPVKMLPNSLDAIFKYSAISDVIDENLEFYERQSAEADENYVQLIPIVVLKQRNERSILVARKAEKAVSAKSPEKKKILVD